MNKITTATTETTHALAERLPPLLNTGYPRGRTWCGRVVFGRTGATIVSGIDCESCRRALRADGWTV